RDADIVHQIAGRARRSAIVIRRSFGHDLATEGSELRRQAKLRLQDRTSVSDGVSSADENIRAIVVSGTQGIGTQAAPVLSVAHQAWSDGRNPDFAVDDAYQGDDRRRPH